MATISELRKKTGLSRPKFCKLYGIPLRTLESWEKNDSEPGSDGARIPAQYVLSMLERLVSIDFPEGDIDSK